jgi:hypothetical protein
VAYEREWWRLAGLVLRHPREVFATLREDSRETALDRTDVIAFLAFAAGVAGALAGGQSEIEELSGIDPFIWVFITGVGLGFVAYWLLGSGLAFVVRRLGGSGSGRRTRHVLAFAFAPFVFAVFLWLIYPPLLLGLAIWSFALLIIGLREVYGQRIAVRAGLTVGLVLAILSVLELLDRSLERVDPG